MRSIDRFRSDLERLLSIAPKIKMRLVLDSHSTEERKKYFGSGHPSAEEIRNLPSFSSAYEAWYSESIVVMKQLLPDRLQDFKEHYEAPKNRKSIDYGTYRIQDALKGLSITRGNSGEVLADAKGGIPHLQQQIAILKAAVQRFESSLFEIRQLVQADLFDSEISAARELLRNKFTRAAGAIAGVVLEKHLQQVCHDHNVKIAKKHPGISDLNEMLKASSVIDVPQWRFISMLGDLRNVCDHNKSKEPTHQQVEDLLDGTDKILKSVF